MPGEIERRYSITIVDFPPASFIAKSASAARYKAWKAWTEAGYGRGWKFRDFLRNVTTYHMGTP